MFNILLAAALMWHAAAARHGEARKADVRFTVDTTQQRSPISPYIYGDNQPDWQGASRDLTLTRLGGNRWTAYNWETNASNAGNDYFFQNDAFLGGGDIPGEAVRPAVAAALKAGAAVIVTVPMAGYVSADKRGDRDVNQTPDFLHKRFVKSRPHKGAPFTYPPDVADNVVYQDEFVNWLEKTFPQRADKPRLFYSLDNEPDLWDSTHARLRTQKLTYAELIQRTIDYAGAIKAVAPESLIFGPASYGWNGYATLQNASDAQGRFFIDAYLAAMRDAQQQAGRRLLDVLDLHWYPEAQGGGKRITESDSADAVVRARLQAPRSLWDPGYTEDSWITKSSTHGPIRLLPLIKQKIAANYPGTRLAITEYNYGGGNHISGGLAEADVLGIFGREGLFAAAFWHLAQNESFIYGGLDMYRNYDGKDAHFGDISVVAGTDDVERTSIYASVDNVNPNHLVIVAINKTDAPVAADCAINAKVRFRTAAQYRLTAASAHPQPDGEAPVGAGNRLQLTLPPMSVTTLSLLP
jgi:hypothetical protein